MDPGFLLPVAEKPLQGLDYEFSPRIICPKDVKVKL